MSSFVFSTWAEAHVRALELAGALVDHLSHMGAHVSTAESCTAGLASALIADVAGASQVLRGGMVTYTNEIKEQVLGVSHQTLERFSAVSAETAREMADGARRVFSADYALSFTGYAGPGGGDEHNSVGTVYIGLATPDHVVAHRFELQGDRRCVRYAAVVAGFELLLFQLTTS
ncbi:nicotinamide-nucleotide amidohydrolase family protein [Collinsella sp. AGMB00827]|uniref:Nicotinamide-nucleotide amidohydrolase family protein n=1 Tax=Collinsella ureilytica TaxID=2869515 RepID=A0ABS7ML23_9ACTN|nr:CinA family protein [Collinsella urealyticum]MBY4797987.1 nicotinamide-nucleotide amidohydrolase family protein [Collinsella urealyticum]